MTSTSWNLSGIGKALFPTVKPLSDTGEHCNPAADRMPIEPEIEETSASTGTHPMQLTASRGQEILRSLPTKNAAEWFVQELQSRDLVGERTWRALWDCYLWFCDEAEIVPLPHGMKSRFAHELSKLCQRGQVRIRESGKLRRLTTYAVPEPDAEHLQVAA